MNTPLRPGVRDDGGMNCGFRIDPRRNGFAWSMLLMAATLAATMILLRWRRLL